MPQSARSGSCTNSTPRAQLGCRGHDVIGHERHVHEAADHSFLAGCGEEHQLRLGSRNAEFDPSLRAVERTVRDDAKPELLRVERRQPAAFLVYLLLWRLTRAAGMIEVQLPLRDLAEGSGLSKRAVQQALSRLVKRELIAVQRSGITAVATYTVRRPWKR